MIAIQCVLSVFTGFYIFAVGFNGGNLAVPCIVALAGAAVSSFFWGYGLRTIFLPTLSYSAAFWCMAILLGLHAFSNFIFLGSLAAGVSVAGLIGAWLGRKGKDLEKTLSN